MYRLRVLHVGHRIHSASVCATFCTQVLAKCLTEHTYVAECMHYHTPVHSVCIYPTEIKTIHL